MPRAFVYLYGAGGTLVLATLLLPMSSDRVLAGMIVPAVAAWTVAILIVLREDRLPLAFYQSLPGIGAVLVTAVAYYAGTGGFNAYALLYFWVIVSAFYFFPWRRAVSSLALVAAGYAIVLLHHGEADDRLLYWVMGVGSLLVASLLLALLRQRIENMVRRLRESDLLKTTIIRSVSHDFRTPLTAIIAAGESSASPSLDRESGREIASVIVTEASRLSETLGKLLDMSRLEAGSAKPHSDWCSIEEIVEAALERTPSDERFDVSGESPLPLVWADAAQLERALLNLFENASRFGHGDDVRVRLESDGSSLTVRVSDRGPGIAEDERERVFEPFYRSQVKADGHVGPGLGLAIAKGFIETNGGRVWAEPAEQTGTTFVVELPLAGPG